MQSLPEALQPFAAYKQFIVWTLIQKPDRPKPDKVPLNLATGKPHNPHDPSIWLDAELTNKSDDTVRIWGLPFPCDRGFEIVVINEGGDTLTSRLITHVILKAGFLLKPRQKKMSCRSFSLL